MQTLRDPKIGNVKIIRLLTAYRLHVAKIRIFLLCTSTPHQGSSLGHLAPRQRQLQTHLMKNFMTFLTSAPKTLVIVFCARFFALAAVLTLCATSSFAASGNWTNTATTGLWSTALNWSPNAVPGTAAGDAVNLNANFTATTLITLDTSATVGTMTYGDSSGTSPLSFTNSGGSTLTFDNNGTASMLTFQGSTTLNAQNVGVPILLANNLYISGGGMYPTFSGTISASTSGLKTITNTVGGIIYSGAISDGSGQVALYQDNGTVTLSRNDAVEGRKLVDFSGEGGGVFYCIAVG